MITSNGKQEAAKAFAFSQNVRNLSMRETAELVKRTAIPLAPRKTGRLQESIRLQMSSPSRYQVLAGYDAIRPYARWQHFGTVKNKAHMYFYKAGGRVMSAGKSKVRKQVGIAGVKSGYRGF